MSKHFHFTLGPVQGFVAQARRTRDFWAGSFLLSWLTAHAMKAVLGDHSQNRIITPSVEDADLLKMVRGKPVKITPAYGSIPNYFIASVPNGIDGEIVSRAVQQAWRALADAVWKKDGLGDININRCLWNQQIKHFWDIAWVISNSAEGSVLAQRKNWRSYMPPETVGDKCTMMGEWQELSGAEKSYPEQQRKFWNKIIEGKGLDLQEGERLCAIAYVKRRFVHAWTSLDDSDSESPEFPGYKHWKLQASVPSVSYMAAAHWLAELIKKDPGGEIVKKFCKEADLGEFHSRVTCVSKALGKSPPDYLRDLAYMDGRLLFANELEVLAARKENKLGEITIAKAKKMISARKAMLDSVEDQIEEPTPFYAVLMMDGDSLGETKAAMKDPTALSVALGEFTQKVPELVLQNSGFLIYAGGDDVLAILPLEDALPCAAKIRDEYMGIFKKRGVAKERYSISAAIEYAHMKLPLTMVLKDVHSLLDDVAKNGTGRDAVACRVWKPGGQQQTWAMPWGIPKDKKGSEPIAYAVDILDRVEEMAKRAEKASDVGYASKWLYSLRETLIMFMPDPMPTKESDILTLGKNIEELQLDKLLEASYINSGLLDGWSDEDEGQSKLAYVRQQIASLMPLMRVHNKQGMWNGLYSSDGALLLRFLVQKGVE